MSLMPACFLTSVCPCLQVHCIYSTQANTPTQMHTFLFTGLCQHFSITVKVYDGGLEAVTATICGLPIPAGPVGCSSQHQPTELLRGLLEFTHIIITLCSMALRGSLYVCVCVCMFVSHMMACVIVFVVLGTMSRSVVSASLTSFLIHILVHASLLFVLTI